MAVKKPSRWQRPPENGKPIETESRKAVEECHMAVEEGRMSEIRESQE